MLSLEIHLLFYYSYVFRRQKEKVQHADPYGTAKAQARNGFGSSMKKLRSELTAMELYGKRKHSK